MSSAESLEAYDYDRVWMWYGSIRQHGFNLDPDTASADEIAGLLNLYYFAPKRAFSQDEMLIERTELYLRGATYTETAEHERGLARVDQRVGKTAIGNTVHKSVASIVARELLMMEEVEPGINLGDAFRPEPSRRLKQKIRSLNPGIINENAGQPDLERILALYQRDATIRSANRDNPARAVNRTRRFLLGQSIDQIASNEGMARPSVDKSILVTVPNGIVKACVVPRLQSQIRLYYGLNDVVNPIADRTGSMRLVYLEDFQETAKWADLSKLQRLIINQCIGSSAPMSAPELRERIIHGRLVAPTERFIDTQHLEAVSKFDKYVAERVRSQAQ